MIIRSEFHDYYDIMQKHGVDKSIVYDRKTIVHPSFSRFTSEHQMRVDECIPLVEIGKNLAEMKDWSPAVGPWLRWSLVVVGFCGRLYPGIHYHYYDNHRTLGGHLYDIEAIDKLVVKLADKRVTPTYKAKARKSTRWNQNVEFNRQELIAAFDTIRDWASDTPHLGLNAPIFAFDETSKRWINPRLKGFDFQKVLGPAEAYQQLQMYISGVLTSQERPMIQISDKDMAAKKGFDEWSFRKKVR